MAQTEETQLGSSVPVREEDLDKVVVKKFVESSGPVFDGFSSSLKFNICNSGGGGGSMRTCSECGKQFSSGKALGGHKRACLQNKDPNNNSRLKLKPTIKIEVAVELGGGSGKGTSSNVEGGGGGGENRCCVCGQCFVNLKSLYGHMRKHPERQWRGIHPPAQQQQQQQQQRQPLNHHHHHHRHHLSASSTISNDRDDDDDGHDHGNDDFDDDNNNDVNDDDDYYYDFNGDDDYDDQGAAAADLVESLRGWSVKDKRGRKSSEKEVDDEYKEAVSNLFYLASTSQKQYSGEGQSSKKRKLCTLGYGVLKVKERRPEADHEDQESSETRQQQKKRKLTELEPQPNSTQRFECSLCKKAFDKHQALGGHVASHNNKSKIKNLSVKESSPSVDEERTAAESDQDHSGNGGGGDDGDDDDDRSSRVYGELGEQYHQCNICSKSFPTGQALGGHKRCHWNVPGPNFLPEAFSSSSQLTTSTGGEVSQISQTPPRRGGAVLGGLNVDLNDTPEGFYQFFGFPEPSKEAEYEAGAGAGSQDNPVR